MADDTIVHIGENSPEHVAYRLLKDIANVEARGFVASADNPADRDYILDTYADCISTVRSAVPPSRRRR